MTIQEIILHPRYREFAAWSTERGRQVMPDGYPWRFMGCSKEKFLRTPLTDGRGCPIEGGDKLMFLHVVRAQERLVEEYWDLWFDEQQIHGPAAKPALAAVTASAPDGEEGWLF